MEALGDSEVPGWWQRLGLPGLVDIHTHFLPERMLRRVWAHSITTALRHPDWRDWPGVVHES